MFRSMINEMDAKATVAYALLHGMAPKLGNTRPSIEAARGGDGRSRRTRCP